MENCHKMIAQPMGLNDFSVLLRKIFDGICKILGLFYDWYSMYLSIQKKNVDGIIVLRINGYYVHENFEEKSLIGSVRIIIFTEVNTLLDEVESKDPSIWNEYKVRI